MTRIMKQQPITAYLQENRSSFFTSKREKVKDKKQLSIRQMLSKEWQEKHRQKRLLRENLANSHKVQAKRKYHSDYYSLRKIFSELFPSDEYLFKCGNYVFSCDYDHNHYYAHAIIHALNELELKKVGEVCIEDYLLKHIYVDKEHRRRKVGYHLIEAIHAMTCYPDGRGRLLVYRSGSGRIESSYDLTDDGAKLINYCINTGLISEEDGQVIDETLPKSPRFY